MKRKRRLSSQKQWKVDLFPVREGWAKKTNRTYGRDRTGKALTAVRPSLKVGEMNKHGQPIVGITMGDGAGVGPEIIVQAFGHRDLYQQCRPLVIGDAG